MHLMLAPHNRRILTRPQTTSNKTLAAPNSPKPESPTTARPLDFDDEPQESGVIPTPQPAGAPSNATEAPPPMPPRPLSPRHEAQNTLTEAFPSVETGVVKAVLVASNWDVERAFHALLSWYLFRSDVDIIANQSR